MLAQATPTAAPYADHTDLHGISSEASRADSRCGVLAVVSFIGMVFWRIREGKLVERWAGIDRLGLQQQLTAS